jgi:hypothetical protein
VHDEHICAFLKVNKPFKELNITVDAKDVSLNNTVDAKDVLLLLLNSSVRK